MSVGKMRMTVRSTMTTELDQHGVSFDANGAKAEREIYQITLGRFDRRNKRNGTDVWKSQKFQRFIILQTKKIARQASKKAKNGKISRKAYTDAAVKVMQQTHKICRARVVGGQVVGFPGAGANTGRAGGEGEICTAFLDSQT